MTTCTMRELTKFAIGGGWGAEESDEDTQKVMVIRGADFPAAALQDLSSIPTRFEKSSKVSNRALSPGDIVLEISGGTKDRPTGRTVFITQKMVEDAASPLIPASFCRRLVIDSGKADPRFVYYWLQNMYATGQTWNYQNRSTGIANFQFEQFLDREKVYLPDRQMQLTISMLLGALDDKIAANDRLIAIALMLQRSYWTKTVSELTKVTLPKVSNPILGGTPKRSDEALWEGNNLWASVADMTKAPHSHLVDTAEKISDVAIQTRRFSPLPAGSVLMSARGTVGRIVSTTKPTSFNQSAYGFVPPEGCGPALRLALLDVVAELKSKSYGSVFSTITKQQINECTVPDVFNPQFDELHTLLNTLESRIIAAELENQALARTRDELLPLLMSGRITVGEAEDAADEAASES